MTLFKSVAVAALIITASTGVFAQVKKSKIGAGVSAATMEAGKAVYARSCVTCHIADGLGVPNMNPPIVKTPYILGPKPKLLSIVLGGFNEKVEINGDTYTNVMPAQDYLKDDEIAAVLTYVRNSFGNKATAVTVAEVKKARASKK
jgi:mono/diheme cytochrome c family protein